ncbi:MAG: hypothetical protein IKM82_01750 [Oscillospiraceae bacterium]|nr:hypothetical protein [Oscillospiraceae bacterium]
MTVEQLLNRLQNIIDTYPDIADAPVEIELWDDNAYDGKVIVGTRVLLDFEEVPNEQNHATVFIIQKDPH